MFCPALSCCPASSFARRLAKVWLGGVDVLDLEHYYIPFIVSTLVVSHWFYMFYTRFYLGLAPQCFKVISGIYGDFEVKWIKVEAKTS